MLATFDFWTWLVVTFFFSIQTTTLEETQGVIMFKSTCKSSDIGQIKANPVLFFSWVQVQRIINSAMSCAHCSTDQELKQQPAWGSVLSRDMMQITSHWGTKMTHWLSVQLHTYIFSVITVKLNWSTLHYLL